METIWENEGAYASDIAQYMLEKSEWKKNTTYTLISRLINKGAVERCDPKFFCKPLISKDEFIKSEISLLIEKLYGGSKKMFLDALLNDSEFSCLLDQH